MSEQATLWHECMLDALGSAIAAAGGFKVVAGKLWPMHKPETGYARLKACLDRNKPEKLDPEEVVLVIRLARQAGDHSVMRYLCQELGYTAPTAIEPEDRRTELQAEFNESVRRLEQIQKAMARLPTGARR